MKAYELFPVLHEAKVVDGCKLIFTCTFGSTGVLGEAEKTKLVLHLPPSPCSLQGTSFLGFHFKPGKGKV